MGNLIFSYKCILFRFVFCPLYISSKKDSTLNLILLFNSITKLKRLDRIYPSFNDKNSSKTCLWRGGSIPCFHSLILLFSKNHSRNITRIIYGSRSRFRKIGGFFEGNEDPTEEIPWLSPPRFVNRRDKSSCSVFFRRRGSFPRREKETPVTECFPLGLKRTADTWNPPVREIIESDTTRWRNAIDSFNVVQECQRVSRGWR